MALDELGLGAERPCRHKCRVEPLHMAHLHLDLSLIGKADEGIGLFNGIGHGLFDEHMLGVAQRIGRTFVMRKGWCNHIDGIANGHQRLDGRECRQAELCLGLLAFHRIGIVETHQMKPLGLHQQLQMYPSQMARAQHSYTYFAHELQCAIIN